MDFGGLYRVKAAVSRAVIFFLLWPESLKKAGGFN